MKTIPQQKYLSQSWRSLAGASAKFPFTDCDYQGTTLSNFRGGCARPSFRSFRNISGDYFRKEARGEFRKESAAFIALVIAAAVPLVSNIHALADFLRSIGRL